MATPAEQLYHLVSNGVRLTAAPMDHAKCLTMRSKFSFQRRALIEIVPHTPRNTK